MIGRYETFIFIAGLVSFFWIGGLLNTSLTIFTEVENKAKFLSSLLFSLLIVNTISCSGLFLYNQIESSSIHFINILLPYIFLNNASFLIEYVYLMQKKSRKLLHYSIFIHIILLSFIFSALYFLGGDLEMLLIALFGYALIKCIWLLFQIHPLISGPLDLQEVKYIWKHALPLSFSIFLIGSAEYIDGIIIKYYYSDAGFAIFRYGAKELPFVLLIASAFSVSTISKVAEDLQASLSYIKAHSARLMHFLIPTSILLMLASDWIYKIVFSEEFLQSAEIFRIYILLVIFRLVFPQTILNGLKRNKTLLWISLNEVIINIGLSLLFIQYWGIAGVAYASVIAFLFDKILATLYNHHILKIRASDYIPFKVLIPYSLIVLLAFYWMQHSA